MLRALVRVRGPLAASAIAAGLLMVLAPHSRPSADRTPARVSGLDRSRKLTAWERKVMDRELPGKTLAEVIRLLGRPDQENSFGREHLRLTYWLGRDGNLKIDFRDGQVSSVAHDAWQTGVREDELVGPVSP